MTEGVGGKNDKPMCVRVWLEVGHACEPRQSALGRAVALDWRVWVRGPSGHDISTFVHKVVFYLHPADAFVYPKRVIQEPPYEIQESGCASIDIPIHVYLKYSIKPKKIRLKYILKIENTCKSVSESQCVFYDVESPPAPLWSALVAGGGEVLARAHHCPALLLVLAGNVARTTVASPDHGLMKHKYKFVEPVVAPRKHKPKKKPVILEDICSKCGDTATGGLRKQLRSVEMSEDEMEQVSQLYLSLAAYERAGSGGLQLPPLSDPVYRVPVLPASLRATLASVSTAP